MTAHIPRAEFRAQLEQDVVRAYQRESQFVADRDFMSRRRMRAVSLVLAGLVLGLTTEFASGQVQAGQERSRLVAAVESTRMMAALQLQLAEEELGLVRSRHAVGSEPRESLVAAEAAVREAQLRIARIELDLAEVRASAEPARDELWAPLVTGRDFVTDRLKIDAASAQALLRSAESRLEERERAHRAGTVSNLTLQEARSGVEAARAQLELLATRLNLRKEFLQEKVSAQDIEWRLRRVELLSELRRVATAARQAQERMKLTRDEAQIGAVTQLEVKRAEVALLELNAQLKQLELQLRELEAIRRKE